MAIELFTQIGTHTWQNPGVDSIDVLVVGGGGGGGVTIGGGGGAGGLVYYENLSVNGSNCDLTVGAGGEGGIEYSGPREQGYPGDDSTFTHPGGTLTALGGGGGAGWSDHTSTAGGSGGGASGDNAASSGNQSGTNSNATIDAGYGGGAGDGSSDPRVGGGGGGAGAAGEDGVSGSRSGDGGVGVDMSTEFGTQFGENGYFAGGGGGGGDSSSKNARTRVAYGGNGGGGDGADNADVDPYGKDAMPNTGGGGGAAAYIGGSERKLGGDGGSGVVIIKYDETAVSSGYVELTWSDGSPDEVGSKIYRGTSSGSLTQIDTVGADQTTYLDFSAVAGETYYYAVSHYSAHDESVQTSEVQITTGPKAPDGLSVTQPNDSEISVSWNDNSSSEDGFYIYRGTESGSLTQIDSVGAGVTTYTDTNFLDGEQYFYSASAYEGGIESNLSSESSKTTTLPSPTNLSVDYVSGDTYALSWDSNANNGTFEVLISATGGSSFVTDANTTDHSTTSVVTTEYNSANEHVIKIKLSTEHVSVESGTITEVLAGSVIENVDGVSEDEQNGVVMTEK
jgi:hypothetical protein